MEQLLAIRNELKYCTYEPTGANNEGDYIAIATTGLLENSFHFTIVVRR